MDTLPDLSFALGVPSASGAGSGSVARLVCQCGRQFTRIENLRRHQRNHQESKLSCPVCSRTFRRPDVLKRHMRTHRDSAGSGSPPAPASAPAPAPAPAPAAGGPPPLAALMGALPTPGEASTSASASATALPAPPHAALEAVMHASVVHGPAYLTSTIPHIPYRPPRVHEADDDDSSSVDEDSDGSELGTWDGAIARAAAAGYTADSGYTLLSPRLAGERMHADDEWSLPGTSASEGGVWLSDAVYTRAKAWCDTRDRSIRWPDLATANALMEAHFERVEPQLPLIYLPTFRTAHAAPSLVAALLASGACAVRHTRARTFACEVAETLRRALDPSADALHALVLAYLAAAGCGSARAPLLLASLAALVRAQRLLAPRDPESEWGAWVRAETRTRLGLAVFLCDAALGIADVEGAAVPDAERWMLAPDAWLAREHASVGAACVLRSNADARLAALPRYPAPMGEFGARVLFATIQWGIRTYRAEERVFCRAQEVLGLALPARLHALETLLEAAGQAYGQGVGYYLGYVLLRAPREEDLEAGTAPDALPVAHAAHLLLAAGWPLPSGDIFAPPAVYHALLVLRAWARGSSAKHSSSDDALVAQLMAPRATAAPQVGPGGILPSTQDVSAVQVLKLGLQWMSAAGASGYAQRIGKLLDHEEE